MDLSLQAIKAELARVDAEPHQSFVGPHAARAYMDWLVGEVERLQEVLRPASPTYRDAVQEWRHAANHEIDLVNERNREIARLRDLLARLEWAGTLVFDDWYKVGLCCPVCRAEEGDPHGDCWLAKELGY